MRLRKARVQFYRSIKDSGWFDVEPLKTIFVGPNEAGKTALLQALQQINPPSGVRRFDPLRDYPRALYNDITTKKVDPQNVTVTTVDFELEDKDRDEIPTDFHKCTYRFGRRLDNSAWHTLEGGPPLPTYGRVKKDFLRLAAHIESRPDNAAAKPLAQKLATLTQGWTDSTALYEDQAKALDAWLNSAIPHVDESKQEEEVRLDQLRKATDSALQRANALTTLNKRVPIFVLFSNYFRVKPLIHLAHLADRIEKKLLDDEQYDYGNVCLLKLLGFTARELSNLGRAGDPAVNDPNALQKYRDQLDQRSYQLNAASVRLTEEIRKVWFPDPDRAEADRLRIVADGQYLKVVVEDDLGVEIELDQRSEGFQWLVSFFIVFFAESAGAHQNAILLLDEPGLSLHGLKQRDFRSTLSRLSDANQTLYTTHSPFLVGPDELDLVRVVEMVDRKAGTKIHTSVTADDPAALLPLQEALGYDLAQSLFAQQRNLVLEGLTDMWYLEAVSEMLRGADLAALNEKIALIPAKSAGKTVYFATILYAHKLKVAALLDSDAAGEQAATQEVLVHTLGNKRILRTKDVYSGEVLTPEIEDLLRESLVQVARADLGWDVSKTASAQPKRPIVEIFKSEIADFSKYKLAKSFVRWTRDHEVGDMQSNERKHFEQLCELVNNAVK
jgi:energy-coupling factor transporter ATP-binding protein EcfA2